MKVGRNEPCPCGSGKKYKRCHGGNPSTVIRTNRLTSFTPVPKALMEPFGIQDGETPQGLKELIETTIKHTFDGQAGIAFFHAQLGRSVRGELCAAVSLLTSWLLEQYKIRSRVVFGSARWIGYPIGFLWKGEREYHSWVETEFGEIVDLACDALDQRSDITSASQAVHAPKICWTKPHLLGDRSYEEVPYGGQEIDVDLPGSRSFDRIASVALAYARVHEKKFLI